MKKTVIYTLLSLLLAVSACTRDLRKGVWVDKHTFRISGTGSAKKDAMKEQRRLQSCEAAKLAAMGEIIMKFAESGIKSVKGKVRVDEFRNEIRKEFFGVIRGGSVVKSIYNEKSGMCTVIYQISERNMKQKMMRLAKRYR